MKIILMSMPDVAPVIMHEAAFHLPNLGIASIGANIDAGHDVYIVDLIRKRRNLKKYMTKIMADIRPDIVGFSAMAWQYDTCVRLIKLVKHLLPGVKVVIGGYHATLMNEEIAASEEAGLIDFIIRGEGEEAFRRLINTLGGKDNLADIPSLSYRNGGGFIDNPRGELLDLSRIKRPIRDKRRLTWGYHIMNAKAEVLETSRGCTRNCSFCSMQHMYGRNFRAYPVERVLDDIDEIYYRRKTRCIFISDDNLVLDPARVMQLCDAIMARKYRRLHLIVQADCVTMSRNEEMVVKMSQAGIKSTFLGIESASKKNLTMAHKGDIIEASRKAVQLCHKHDMMVVGGMIFGFPDDEEIDIVENYRFLKELDTDTAYCQILTPYPKTAMRRELIEQGLVTNLHDYRWYNGIWSNVRTRHLDSEQLQYLVWYHRQTVMGWWEPSERVRKRGRMWTAIWIYLFKPLLKVILGRKLKKIGWKGRYTLDMKRQAGVNVFPDLEEFVSSMEKPH